MTSLSPAFAPMQPAPESRPPRIDWRIVAIIIATAVLCVLCAYGLGRCSAPEPDAPIVMEIDAGPGEAVIAAELDAAVKREDERLDAMAQAHAEEVTAFSDADLLEYEERKREGQERLAAWLAARTRRLLRDGGVR